MKNTDMWHPSPHPRKNADKTLNHLHSADAISSFALTKRVCWGRVVVRCMCVVCVYLGKSHMLRIEPRASRRVKKEEKT